ncbi:NADH-quinone oxidoreductase subunit C [Desulfothermobacter acidiphilus]|uniref:NADH-quinone oxidoreductase subunit C n=1 Tax=Desulfothermobacter acidiphilus TaxID=1938353 RepID=UPI003F8B7766
MSGTDSLSRLLNLFPGLTLVEDPHLPVMAASPAILPELVRELRESHGFNLLADLTAVDYPEAGVIEVIYHLMAVPEAREVRIKVRVDRASPEIPSLAPHWPAANVQEREVYDLLGVKFIGHPCLQRILCPPDFPGHPLRKDFSLPEELKER